MWVADNWKDYKVIDATCGEKLEKWGKYILIRPDPQVIWKTKKSSDWKQKNGHYHRSSKGGGEWEFFQLPNQWTISYNLPVEIFNGNDVKSLVFNLKPFSFKHTGVFP